MIHPERLVAVVLFDRVDLLDVTGPAEVFALLQREMTEPTGYTVVLAAASLEPVLTSAGVRLIPDVAFADLAGASIDTLVVPGAVDVDEQGHVRARVDAEVVHWVSVLAKRTRRVSSVCVGAHVLAAAGLLDGKRATTHWSTAAQLAEDHPEVSVDADPIFIVDGGVWTGAGLSACLDLALALVADDFGNAVAQRVARQLVMYLRRPSGQSQFSVPLEGKVTSKRIDELKLFITANITSDLTLARLAERMHVSERQLTRIVKTELGMTPASYVEAARTELARNLLETSDDTLQHIAERCGLGSADTLTRAFRRTKNITPTEYRARFRVR